MSPPNAKLRLISNNLRQIGLLILLTSSLVACSNRNPILIKDITQKQPGTVIYVTGQVKDLAPLIKDAAYRLQDDTGGIWVITSGILPVSGTQIKVKGKIQQQNITIAAEQLNEFYLLELEQLPSESDLRAANN
ncbi:MAG: hypothetical protein QNJ70_23460 [Xenococcaceae cyanobacterium MO_207.B15]|nr:hypothetical protein [Xenococcaceae cyanobacterium MO_207.B15]